MDEYDSLVEQLALKEHAQAARQALMDAGLAGDRSRKVRTMAASMLGFVAHRRQDAARALEVARDADPHPVVRQVAGWYAPVSTISAICSTAKTSSSSVL